IACVLFHKPEARWHSVAKELMIALGFGGGFANWTSKVLQDIPLASDEGERGEVAAWLYGFETAARLYHVAVFELLPQKAKDWHTEQGRSTASGALQMEKMAAAAGRVFNNHQHDGIGALILGRARANTVDFAKLAAAQTTYESFEKGGFWLVQNRDDLGQTVEDLMCKMCVWQARRWRTLTATILFCDGMLYDFKATKLFEHILAFLKEHLETGVCLLKASENGKQVIECFEKLEQDGCEILRHMKVYGDWDSVLYELRLMTRAISATPRFCEMYYIWGSQDSGKDTKVKMLHAFLGHGKDNYGVQLPGNYVVQQTRYLTAKDGPAPYHARTLGKRLAWASEVPERYSLADDFIKPFCDMEGAPVCSRKLNKGPRDFMPTALLVATSNHPPRVTRPDGMLRRLRVCQITVSFTLKPSMATEERAVDGLKTRINRGEFNKYIFFLAANLVDSLEMEYNPGTEIKPQPPEMKMSAMDLVPCADKDEEAKPEAFMAEMCELVPLKEANLHTELTMALKTYLSLDTLGAAKSVISKLGIKGQSYGPRYISTLKQNERMVGVKLRSASSS
ncbi:unnamed protein product, partial [Effrenium voratum]